MEKMIKASTVLAILGIKIQECDDNMKEFHDAYHKGQRDALVNAIKAVRLAIDDQNPETKPASV